MALTAATALILTGHPASAQDSGNNYPVRNWFGAASGGEMNISDFIFRDVNANGVYDLGDRAFAYAAVQIVRPSQPPAMERSNISGFANFSASLTSKTARITGPGAYKFRVIAPPGYRVTTGNEEQTVPMAQLQGSPGDLVATTPAEPVGLAPLLKIDGQVATQDKKRLSMQATDPNGKTLSVKTDTLGRFSIPASPGSWIIKGDGVDANQWRVDVGQFPVVLPSAPSPAKAGKSVNETASFDDLISGEYVAKIPSGYDKLNWHNWVVTHNRTYEGEGYINGTTSGEYVAYNGSGHPASIDSDEPFDFLGGHFSVAWASAEGETLHIKAWRGDTLAHEDNIQLSALGPVYFAASYKDITRLEFATEHYWQVVIDDLAFSLKEG